MNIFKNTQGESLPNGWKLKQQVEEWLEEPSRTLPHFLDGDKIARTMAESAGLKAVAPASSYGKDGSLSIFFSTGAYFAICPGLVEEWRGMVGSETSSFRLDGSEVKLSVIHVDKDEDQSGSIERYRVKLENRDKCFTNVLQHHSQGLRSRQPRDCKRLCREYFHAMAQEKNSPTEKDNCGYKR